MVLLPVKDDIIQTVDRNLRLVNKNIIIIK
jgi:hypothetical protein